MVDLPAVSELRNFGACNFRAKVCTIMSVILGTAYIPYTCSEDKISSEVWWAWEGCRRRQRNMLHGWSERASPVAPGSASHNRQHCTSNSTAFVHVLQHQDRDRIPLVIPLIPDVTPCLPCLSAARKPCSSAALLAVQLLFQPCPGLCQWMRHLQLHASQLSQSC